MKKKFLLNCSLLLAAAVLILSGCSSIRPPVPPRISEGSNHNHSSLADSAGNFSDWIEVHNPGSEPLSLEGYTLSDSEKSPRKWAFPEETILQPGEYRVVFCSREKDADPAELHASFRISSKGEPILLCDPAGKIVSRLDIPELPEDVSIGFDPSEESPLYYLTPTPGKPNTDGLKELPEKPDIFRELRITEYASQNSFQFYDLDGDCSSWAEIQNFGKEPVDLGGFLLSDDPYNLNKWAFPENLILEPGAYQLIFLSGKDRWKDGELHADFRLGREDTHLVLSDPEEKPIHRVKLVELEENISYGLVPGEADSWAYFALPTPGKENTSQNFPTLDAGTALPVREVWINEVMAVSGQQAPWQEDWIELYNGSDRAVELTGWNLSDSASELKKYTFPETVLQPGEFLLLSADGAKIPFQISASGESLFLTRPDGSLCDRFETGRQKNGCSSGRADGLTGQRLFFHKPTPSAPNSEGFSSYTQLPVFSQEGVYLDSGQEITITGEGQIRYTLDGSEPSESSPLYEKPIPITKNTILRAACFSPDKLCGGIASHTYLPDTPHQISVICLSTAPANLFNYSTGIYEKGPSYDPNFPHLGANFWKDWERPVHFELYEPDGEPGISFDAGVRIFGQYSRAIPQKSLSIHLRESYGLSEIRYPFFENNPITEYHDLLLRTSGQDWNMSKLRDALCYQIVKGQMDIDGMDWRPAALYINGQYWGLYNLRDKVNEQYLYTHHGTDPDNVDIIKGDSFVLAGDKTAYRELMNYLYSHSLRDEDNFRYIESLVDVDEVLDYWIAETFFANTDTGNIKIYRERSPGSRWRLVLFDLDWSLFSSTYQWNMLSQAMDPAGHGVANLFSTRLLRSLLENDSCRQKFIQRYAHHLNTTFSPERTSAILRQMAETIESEIPRQQERWGQPKVSRWEREIAFLEKALASRHTRSIQDLQAMFGLSSQQMKELFPQ